jgi:spore coat assembly protein SafA
LNKESLELGKLQAGVARRPMPRGFATGGIIRGPGTGTSDSIMAMLSDGEAVIPAKQVKKYGPVVEQLISDNIPGFADGRSTFISGGQSVEYSGLGFYGPQTSSSKLGFTEDFFRSGPGMGQSMQASAIAGGFTLDNPGGRFNQQAFDEYQAATQQYIPEIVNTLRAAEADMSSAGLSISSIDDVLEHAESEMRAIFAKMKAAGGKTASAAVALEEHAFYPTEATMGGQFGETRAPGSRVRSNGRVETSMYRVQDSPFRGRVKNAFRRLTGQAPTGQYAHLNEARRLGPSFELTGGGLDLPPEEQAPLIAGVERKGQQLRGKYSDTISVRKIGATARKDATAYSSTFDEASQDPYVSSRDRSSPHPLASQDGRDDGIAYSKARADAQQDPATAARPKTPLRGNLAAPLPPVPPAEAAKTFDRGMRGVFQKVGDGMKKNAKSIGEKMLTPVGVAVGKMTGNTITDNRGNVLYDADAPGEAEARRARQNLGMGEPARLPDMEPLATDKNGKAIVGPDGQPYTASQYKQVKKEAKRQSRQQRAGRALGVLGTATMVAGMATQVEGRVGEAAQKALPALAGLSAIAPVLMALPAPLAALVAVIGLGVTAFMLYNKAIKEARAEAFELTRSLGTGKDAMSTFAEAAGKATSSEIMDRRRAGALNPYQTQPGKTPFGESFLASEDGQNLKNVVEGAIASRGMDFAQENLSRQLQAALLDGSLTIEQARGIALALGQELDDLGFSMRINAELNQIFGPEGENLLENPLQLQIEFMQQSTIDATQAIDGFEEAFEAVNLGNIAQSTVDGFTEEVGKVGPWLEENVPGWFQAIPLVGPITRLGAYVTAGFKGLWTGSLEPGVQLAEAAGTAIGQLTNTIESYQMSLDATANRYDKMIADAEAEGNATLASELREEKLQAEIDLLEQYQAGIQALSSDYKNLEGDTRAALSDELDIQLRAKFEEDPEQKKILEDSLGRISALNLDDETEYFLKLNVNADAFSLTTLDYLSNLEDGAITEAAVDVAMNVGGKDAELAVQIAKMFGTDAEGIESQTEFLTRVSTEDPEEAKATITTMAEFAKLTGLVGKDADIYMRAALEMDDEQLANFQADMDYLNSLNGAEITTTMVTEHLGDDVAGIIADNQEYFDSLPPDQQLRYSMIVNTMMTAVGSPEFTASVRAWAASKGLPYSLSDADAIRLAPQMIADMADRGTRGSGVAGTGGEGTTPPGGSGSEPQVDSMIKKLRDLRLATIDMKKGWEGMQQVLSSTFANGAISQFNGLEKQIRNLGVGEGLIAQIVGMDPDEYNKRKNELFEFDNAGNIVKAKAALTNMNEAFNAVAIGEYVNSQENFLQKTKDQISAISILTANGMSLADAYDAVQDAALAAAIAQGASREEIQEILRITELVKEQEERLEAERERSRISESVRKTNEEFRNQVAVLKELSRAQGQYTDAQIQALMSDSDLQKLMLDPTIDSGALQEALRNAEQKSNLEVQINLLTKTGQETEFDKYLAEVNDYFTKEENLININFDIATADDNKLIEDAQNQIAAIQYKLDDYNAELEQISWIEEDINEKYDKRSEALDTIADANEKIANQQKAQLDIADALSRGDITAAATAVQALRSEEVKSAAENQKQALDKAREAELRALVGPSGMTREQLEEQITNLERQVFQLEEDFMEPAQERNRLAEITRDLAIDQLKLNELTRMEFDKIAAATKQSAINMEDMITSSEKLAALAEFIQTGTKNADWDRLFPQPKAAPPPPPPSSGGGGRPAPPPPPPPPQSYTVKSGDWLSKIAPKYGVSTAQLIAANPQIKNPNLIFPGQKINIPGQSSGGLTKYAMGGLAKRSRSGPPLQMAMGGKVGRYANGGMIIPKRMAMGGYSMGTDIVPAILTPGEFVVRRPAVSAFGADKLEKINRGTYNDGSVYNYNLAVNVKSDSDPNRIARAVITNIKSIENQRIRGNKL